MQVALSTHARCMLKIQQGGQAIRRCRKSGSQRALSRPHPNISELRQSGHIEFDHFVNILKINMNESKCYRRLHTSDNELSPLASIFATTKSLFKLQRLSSHVLFYTILLMSNVVSLSLWLMPHSKTDCIRPQLIYCTPFCHQFAPFPHQIS